MDYHQQRPFKPLVVGSPRSGFTLLNSIVIHFTQRFYQKWDVDLKLLLLRHFVECLEETVSNSIVKVFEDEGLADDLIYNGNFRELVGGPKWIDPNDQERACFRKYIGVRGKGDFLLITTHPRQVLDFNEVIHSHASPKLWAEHSGYEGYTKYSSVRNPIGTVNSACFSINAIASEYIQKFMDASQDNDEMRTDLALYKLTNLDFFSGILSYYKEYWTEFLNYRDHFIEMKWEDLILEPEKTILSVAKSGNVKISPMFAESIWDKIGYRNLTGHHQHNYRKGKAKVGDWKNSLTNEHLDLFKELGFGEFMTELGYDEIQYLDSNNYTPYQKRVSEYIKSGQIYDQFEDRDLFGFAFQKSNLKWENLSGFHSSDWKSHTKIERSCFTDVELENRVWEVAENVIGNLNALFEDLLNSSFEDKSIAQKSLQTLVAAHKGNFSEIDEMRFSLSFQLARELVQKYYAPLEIIVDEV